MLPLLLLLVMGARGPAVVMIDGRLATKETKGVSSLLARSLSDLLSLLQHRHKFKL